MAKIDALTFERKAGHYPANDDLERANCPNAGSIGHTSCGWCHDHDKPQWECQECAYIKMRVAQEGW
jgi:hypothetical protein